MRVSFDVNVKLVLTVVAVGALTVGSFFAGMRYQAARYKNPIDLSAGLITVIPDSAADDSEVSWCAAHPSTNWKFAAPTADAVANMRKQGLPKGSAFTPLTGSCDANGNVVRNGDIFDQEAGKLGSRGSTGPISK
jgi:hypothetical protein